MLLGLHEEQLPEARAWPQLLGALVRVRRWLRDVEGQELSDYMRASRARDLLETIAPPLSIAGIEVARSAGIESAWADLERAVASAVARLDVGSSPARQPTRGHPQAKRSAGAVERLGR